MGIPYTMEECLAQAQALMKIHIEKNAKPNHYFTIIMGNGLTINPQTRQVFLKEKELKLTRKEFYLLFCLASNPGQVFSREQLYNYVWNEEAIYNVDDVVKAHIKGLRKKLSDVETTYIKNVWGIGYYFHDNDKHNPFFDGNYVCCSIYGKPKSKDFHWVHFKKLLKENGLPDIRWHDLRATYCTILLKNDFNPKAVSKLMGHAKEIITIDVYGDNREIIEDCLENLEPFIDEVLPEEEVIDLCDVDCMDLVALELIE